MAERKRLESVRTSNRTMGSNPILSVFILILEMIHYQRYTSQYFQEVRSLITNTIATLNRKDYTLSTLEIMISWQNEKRLKEKFSNGTYFLALSDEKVVGIGGLVGNEVCTMFVAPDFNGKGIGKEILKMIESQAKSDKLQKLILSSTLTAEKFYNSCGFSTTTRTIHKLDGNDFEVYEMEKYLQN